MNGISKGGISLALSLLLLPGLLCQGATPAQTLYVQPALVGIGNDTDFNGHWDWMSPGCCMAYNGLPSTYNYRSAIEFDLQNIPAGAVLQSATLFIQYDGAAGWPDNTLQFNQYIGNGALDLGDFEQINQIGPLLNSFGPGDGTLWYKVPVTPIVNSFRSNSQRYLGVMIQNTVSTQTLLREPYLSVTYVPEPATLGLLCGFMVSAMFLRRR